MAVRLVFRTKISGMEIHLIQRGIDWFEVVYHLSIKPDLTYDMAASELGAAIMHALACDGLLDNRKRG